MECRGVLVYADGSIVSGRAGDMAFTGKRYFPSADEFGYPRVGIQGKKYGVGQLVLEAYGPPRPSAKHTVEHLNRIRSDNRIANLVWATRREQCLNRNKLQIGKNRGVRLIEYRKVGDAEWVPCDGFHEAARIVGGAFQNIRACVVGKQKTAYGHEFRAVENQPDLEGEEWRTIDNIQVSNMGRILRRGKDKFTPIPAGGQMYAQYAGKKVHRLVCRAFRGEPLNESLTVEHRNRNRSDNRLANLVWATKVEQRANQGRCVD